MSDKTVAKPSSCWVAASSASQPPAGAGGRAGHAGDGSGTLLRRYRPIPLGLTPRASVRSHHALRMAGIDRYRTLFARHPQLDWLRFDGAIYWAADDDAGTKARHHYEKRRATTQS